MITFLQLQRIILLGSFLNYVSSQTTTYNCLATAPCGCSANSASLTKIVGGESAASQTWGWAVSLRHTGTNSHFCGGSIISASHILTAAHCTIGLQSASSVNVYFGSIYLSTGGQTREVSEIYIHPSYSPTTYVDDISILKLSSPLDLNQAGVDLICLPAVSSTILATQEYPPVGANLIAIGWGYLQEGSGAVSETLQQVTVQAVAASNVYCQNARISDSSKQFCAGIMPNGGKDTCQGDSGGPLSLFNSNNVWEQVGITSSGVGCAEPGYPGIYTRVATYQSWINDTMNHANHLHLINYRIFIPIILLVLL